LDIIFFTMKAWPTKRKELLQTLHSIVGQVRKESGCLHSCVYQNVENENEFLLLEKWSTREASDAHIGSDIFTVLRGTESLMRQTPEIEIYTVDRSMASET